MTAMGLLPNTQNCGLRMRRECRECIPRHRLQRNPLVSDAGMHHGTCVTHVPWCMSGSLTRGDGENFPCIPGTRTTRNFAYLIRGTWDKPSCGISSLTKNPYYWQSISSISTGSIVSLLLSFPSMPYLAIPKRHMTRRVLLRIWNRLYHAQYNAWCWGL